MPRPEPAADFHPVQAGQHPVQQDQVRPAFGGEAQGGEPVGGEDHLESGLDEVVRTTPAMVGSSSTRRMRRYSVASGAGWVLFTLPA